MGKAQKTMAKSHLALVTPATVGTVGPSRRPPKRVHNAEVRAREYLTNAEVDRLIKAAGANRNGHRDGTMVLVAYRHGLRPVELVTLRWDAIDFAHGQIHVSRAKNGAPNAPRRSHSSPSGSCVATIDPGEHLRFGDAIDRARAVLVMAHDCAGQTAPAGPIL